MANKKLKAVTLKDLVESDRIIYLTPYRSEREYHKKTLSNIGDELVFYIDEKTDLATPLTMKLYSNGIEHTLIPNCPVDTLTYEKEGWTHFLNFSAPLFDLLGIRLPCGYGFNNRRRSPAGKKGLYFKATRSGWKNDEQGEILEARVEYTFEDGVMKKGKSIIKYKV